MHNYVANIISDILFDVKLFYFVQQGAFCLLVVCYCLLSYIACM